MTPLRVLMISNLCPPYFLGGYEIACLEIALRLHGRGHNVRLLTTPSHLSGPEDPPFVVRCLDLREFEPQSFSDPHLTAMRSHEAGCSNFANTSALITHLREFQPDVVYCWNLFGIGGLAILDTLNISQVPWVIHLMDRVPELIMSQTPLQVRSIFNASGPGLFKGAHVISMSQHLLDEIQELTGLGFDDNVDIIPGWVDCAPLTGRRHYQLGGMTRFVSAGAVHAHKGIDLILVAAATLQNRFPSKFTIDIYGDGQVSHYIDVASRLGVTDCVRFCGQRSKSELLEQYRNSDAFLFPTWEREPFGFAPIEAAAAGCVPVITRNCGVAERLVHGVHCLKIERNCADLERAMADIVAGNVGLRQIGMAGASLVHSDLSLQSCAARIEAILSEVRKSSKRSSFSDSSLLLLAYVKHHLARGVRFNAVS